MFRELTRKNKQIPHEECVTLLTRETRGVLAVNGGDGYPYAMPMNHFYNPDDGCIYFHCGKTVTVWMPCGSRIKFPSVSVSRAAGKKGTGLTLSAVSLCSAG